MAAAPGSNGGDAKNDAASEETLTSHLPLDIVEEILCRLPVKHLRQLCCVSKSWNSLISRDSKFAKKHLKFKLLPPLKISCDQTLYTLVYDRFINNYKIFALSFFNNNKKPQNFDALDNWIQELPDHHIFHRPPEVNVHILGTDYWRRIRDHHVFPRPGIVMSDGEGIFVSDTVNWLAYDTYSSSEFIVSLDLENESYRKLLPPLCHLQSKTSVSLGVLRDCLSLLTHSDNFDKFFGVWIMKEHRNEESWIKLLSIPHVRMRDCGFCTYTKVLYISEDNRVLMEFLKNPLRFSLVIYDSVNDTFKIPEIQNKIHGHDQMVSIVNIYLESLISPFFQH